MSRWFPLLSGERVGPEPPEGGAAWSVWETRAQWISKERAWQSLSSDGCKCWGRTCRRRDGRLEAPNTDRGLERKSGVVSDLQLVPGDQQVQFSAWRLTGNCSIKALIIRPSVRVIAGIKVSDELTLLSVLLVLPPREDSDLYWPGGKLQQDFLGNCSLSFFPFFFFFRKYTPLKHV